MSLECVVIVRILTLMTFFVSFSAQANQCRDLFQAQSIKHYSSIQEAASELYEAIKNRNVGAIFPVEVDGKTLIPPRVLETLNSHLDSLVMKNSNWITLKQKLVAIDSIKIEKWEDNENPVIVINYRDQKEERVLGTFKEEYSLWNNYLRKGLQKTDSFFPLDIKNLPGKTKNPYQGQSDNDRVKNNDFNTERTWQEYNSEYFSNLLSKALKKLDGRGVWIDMGAGSARAQRTYYTQRKRTKSIPRLISVGYEYPDGYENFEAVLKALGNPKELSYVEGKQTLDSLSKFPKADVITDVMGIMTYHSNPVEVFKRYLEILRPGGTILIHSYNLDKISDYVNSQANLKIIIDEDGSLIVRKSD